MMKIKTDLLPLGVAGAAIVSLGWATPTHALAVFGNDILPITNTNSTVINDSNVDPNTGQPAPQRKAVGFTTDSRDWTLNNVTLGLVSLDSGDVPIVEIRSDNSGDPGTTVVTLSRTTALPGSGGRRNFIFTPTAATTLSPNTTYWLYVSGGTYNWFENGPVDQDGVALEDANGNALPGDLPTALNGSGWLSQGYKFTGNASLTWGTGNGLRNAFSIDADEITPIPFAFTPIPGLIVSGIIGGLKRARKKAIETVEA
ncbi:hypothetical protein LEP3755_58120 [Leptolyngbya sp. NIES-3755]|nr:hypothetical protein LEP3755_58120 [Leptolyngbya sp. NIES-3755]